jgi:hypothetical protein
LGIDFDGFSHQNQYIKAFIHRDSKPSCLNHDRIGRIFTQKVNRDCLGGRGACKKMLEEIKHWVIGK